MKIAGSNSIPSVHRERLAREVSGMADSVRFSEDNDPSLLRMTLNAYKAVYFTYQKMKSESPSMESPLDLHVKHASRTQAAARFRDRQKVAYDVGKAIGESRRHSFFEGLKDKLHYVHRIIMAEIEAGVKAGEDLPKKHLSLEENKLLALRLRSLVYGRYADMEMTPEDLRAMTPKFCPVLGTRIAVHSGDPLHSDTRHAWSVERMANSLGYDRENIAIISVHANQSRGNLAPLEILERAAGIVQDDSLTQIQWCRLLNSHWSNLRLEDPYLNKISPPITWPAPRYYQNDPRQLATMIGNEIENPEIRGSIGAQQIAQYYEAIGSEPEKALKKAEEFLSGASRACKGHATGATVNLLNMFLPDSEKRMLNELGKEIYGPASIHSPIVSGHDSTLISRTSPIGCTNSKFTPAFK